MGYILAVLDAEVATGGRVCAGVTLRNTYRDEIPAG